MSVLNQTIYTESTANGVTTVYPYTFQVLDTNDLVVCFDNVVQSSGYTVSGIGNPSGGNITFSSAPAVGIVVLRKRLLPLQRLTDYQDNGDLLADNLNNDFDRLWQFCQQIQQYLKNAIKLPFTTSADQTINQDAASRSNHVISFDSSGNVILLPAVTGTSIVDLAQSTGSSLSGHIADLPSSVARTLQAKVREVISAPDNGGTNVITLSVPSQYATIQLALDYLANKRIAAGTTVKIQAADGTYNLITGLNLNHPDGSQIQLLGNVTTPANCILSVAGSGFDCLTVSNGNKLGLLDGFKFFKTAKALAADNTTAVLANNNGSIICGSHIVVDNWYYGIAARNDSYIHAPSASVDHAGDVGIWAFCGSMIDCDSAVSNNTADVANNWGYGFQAEYGSSINGTGLSATGCRIAGIASLSNSQVRALTSTSSTNTGSGFLARDGGKIECHGSTASSNTRYGVETITDGHVYYTSITTASNTLGNFSPKAYFDNGALGARLVADDGDLRIDNSGTGFTYFNTSGGTQFGVSHTASAVNRLQVTGAATGGKPVLSAVGSDSVIDISILPKGAGSYVQIGAGYTATGDVACNGWIPVKDNTGAVRKLMTTA